MKRPAFRSILAVVLVIGMMTPMLAALTSAVSAETATAYPEENG